MTDLQIEIALRLLKEKADISYIVQVTGLSVEEIKILKCSNNL